MMKRSSWKLALSLVLAGAPMVVGVGSARAQTQSFDHLTCVNVSTDRRLAKAPPTLTLTAEQTEFLNGEGCRVIGAVQVARADQLCFPTAKTPSNPPSGLDLSGQDFLCYRIKCQQNDLHPGGNTQVSIADQFGSGTVFVNQRPTSKLLCVPAFLGAGPSPTPGPTGTPVAPTPTPIPIVTPTPSPIATPTPTSGGSASRAFVESVASLLR